MLRLPVPYDPDWQTRFQHYRELLAEATGLSTVHHIGSTAVPDLPAKPIIDIQLGVPSLDCFDTGLLEPAGFEFAPEITHDDAPFGTPSSQHEWRKLYARRHENGQRAAHLHIRQTDLPNFRLSLLFRDFLRSDAQAASNYGAFKCTAARVCAESSEAGGSGTYLDLKDPVVRLLMAMAENWAHETRWEIPSQ